MSPASLPENFRKLDLHQRQDQLRDACNPPPEEWDAVSPAAELDEIADIMVEGAIGSVPVPLGIAAGFLIDGQRLDLPMAVEEPSVIAAAAYAAGILRRGGGMSTWAHEPVMTVQVFLEDASAAGEKRIRGSAARIGALVDRAQPKMKERGGGFRGLELRRLPDSGILVVDIRIDVRQAMGANALNTAGETVRAELESLSGGRAVMSILSNAARERRAGARFSLPLSRLSALGPRGMGGA